MLFNRCLYALLFIVVLSGCSIIRSSDYDSFAQCLAEKGVVMYGAFWCPHCEAQKLRFGDSFQYMTYVECSLPDRSGQTQVCIDAKIESYPTWEFSNGSRIEGEIELIGLAKITGCNMAN